MSDIFITADEHHGHENIIKYTKRPFTSLQEQTETIISRHNEKVPDNQNMLTIHVGDWFWHTLTLDQAFDIIKRSHGKHAFIFGNHDELIEKYRSCFEQKLIFVKGENKASGIHRIKFNNHDLTLCHYAMRVWNASHKGSWMVFGHSHNELPVVGKSFDIGVDGNNFYPWSLEEIAAKMETLEVGHKITNVWAGKRGSTVHMWGCDCGFCKMGETRA